MQWQCVTETKQLRNMGCCSSSPTPRRRSYQEVEIVDKDVKLQRPVWTSESRLDEAELQRMRDEFWDTQPAYGGSPGAYSDACMYAGNGQTCTHAHTTAQEPATFIRPTKGATLLAWRCLHSEPVSILQQSKVLHALMVNLI